MSEQTPKKETDGGKEPQSSDHFTLKADEACTLRANTESCRRSSFSTTEEMGAAQQELEELQLED